MATMATVHFYADFSCCASPAVLGRHGVIVSFFSRCVVQAICLRSARQVLAMLLICMAVMAVITCQLHVAPDAHDHAASPGHHHSPSSHASGDMPCVTGVLSTMMFFTSVLFVFFHIAPLLVPNTLITFPPFRPPRTAV